MAKVIALVNRKGGVGKTTSAAYIAMCLFEAGRKVTGIDLDPDKSWLQLSRSGALPHPVFGSQSDNLQGQIKGLEDDFVVIDTPPNDEAVIYAVARLADEVIIPLSASGFDANRILSTLRPVAKVEKGRGKPLASVLLVQWNERYKISHEVDDALVAEGIPVLDSRITHKVRYKAFDTPTYLDEYQAVLKELEVL